MSDKVKVIDCKQADNEYLHKDFHGALCYAIKYLDENYGHEATESYLQQVAKTYYSPLAEKLKAKGLKVLEDHWRQVFQREQGQFMIYYEKDCLVLEVTQCPAITHMKKRDTFCTERYCQTTVVINETICEQAGFQCSCDYQPGEGKCVQKFWKERP